MGMCGVRRISVCVFCQLPSDVPLAARDHSAAQALLDLATAVAHAAHAGCGKAGAASPPLLPPRAGADRSSTARSL